MSARPHVSTPVQAEGRRRLLLSAGLGLGAVAAGSIAATLQVSSRSPGAAPAPIVQPVPPPGAIPAAVPTDIATPTPFNKRLTASTQLMAGITPAAGDPVIDRLATLDAFIEHRTWMRANWPPVQARLSAMSTWRAQHLEFQAPRSRTLLYPFSGPDFLNAYALFPDHARYVLFGLERPGELPDLAAKTAREFGELLVSVREALRDIFERNYFITSYMSRQLTAPRLRGTVPVIAVMMALNKRQIVSVDPVELFPDLAAGYALPDARRPRVPMRGTRIVFFDPVTRTTQQLHYFSLDASDRALTFYPGFSSWLAEQGPSTALLKSASYLLHDRQFMQVRDALLTTADTLLQDDTGVPLRVLREAGWTVKLFGEYRKPIPALAYGYQRDLEAAYSKLGALAPLPFPFGYHWKEGGVGSGLMIATRGLVTANAAGTITR